MSVKEMTISVKINRPKDDELPTERRDFYVVSVHGHHSIMTYSLEPVHSDKNWFGSRGDWDKLSNDEVVCWMDLPFQDMNL